MSGNGERKQNFGKKEKQQSGEYKMTLLLYWWNQSCGNVHYANLPCEPLYWGNSTLPQSFSPLYLFLLVIIWMLWRNVKKITDFIWKYSVMSVFLCTLPHHCLCTTLIPTNTYKIYIYTCTYICYCIYNY